MSTTTIQWNLHVGGVLTDATSVVFRDPTNTFGVRRLDTLAVVVAAGVALVHTGLGTYSYTFVDPAGGLVYNYWIEWVYNLNTFRYEQDISGTTPGPTPPVDAAVTAGCGGRYAEAWQFAAFWCVSTLLARVDDSGASGKVYLEDTQTDFITSGVVGNVGMVLYNLTDGSRGVVTLVQEHRLYATMLYGTDNKWDDGDSYRIVLIDAHEIATINSFLDIAASDIHAALAASGACDCTFASWAITYLKKLNIIDASIFYTCTCAKPNITDEARAAYLEWMNAQLELIRTGKLELCAGATGAEFPAIDWASQSVTEFAAAQIIFDSINAS